jgi:hypothetical protein
MKGEFAVVPTDKIESGIYHKKFLLIWTAYLWHCMSHDQRDLKVTYLKNSNFRSDFIVMTSYMDMSSDVAHAIVVMSYMDMSSDLAHTFINCGDVIYEYILLLTNF